MPQPGVQGLGLQAVGVGRQIRMGSEGDRSPRAAAVSALVSGGKQQRRAPRNGRPPAAALIHASSIYRTTPARPSSSGWSTRSEGSLPLRSAFPNHRNPSSLIGTPVGWQAGAHERWMPIPTSLPTFSLGDEDAEELEHVPAQAPSPAPAPSQVAAAAPPRAPPRKAKPSAPGTDDLETLLADRREDPDASLLADVSAVMGGFFPTSNSEPDNVIALRSAVMSGDTALVQVTVAENGGLGLLLQGRPMPLQLAASRGDVSMARALCALGGRAAIEARSLTGQTPLHTAASCGHAEVCAVLIDTHPRCVDLLATSDAGSVGSSPLHLACRLGCTEAADVLLARGANPRRADDTIGTTLHYAARGLGPGRYFGATKPALKLIASLILHGAEVNDTRGIPPPETNDPAVAAANTRQANLLERPIFNEKGPPTGQIEPLSAQAGAELVKKRGWTPLHHAVHCSQWRIVVYLVYAGANAMAKDDDGITPLRVQPAPIPEQDRIEFEQKLRVGGTRAGDDASAYAEATGQGEEDPDAEADAAAEAQRRGLYGEDAAWMGVDSVSSAVRLGAQLRRLKEDEEKMPPPLDISEDERYNGFAATYERLFGAYFKLGEEGPEARARAAARAARPRRTPLSPRVTPGRKFALVIANGRYTKDGLVPGVAVDADGVAKALAANGWAVQQIHDAPKTTILAALSAFVSNITGQHGHRSTTGESSVPGSRGLLGPPLPSWAMSNSSFSATGARLGGVGRQGMRSAASFAPMSAGTSRSTLGNAGLRPQTAPTWIASLMLPDADLFGGGVPPPQSSPADILVWYGGAAASVQGRNVLLPNDVDVSSALLSHSARRVLSSGIAVSDLTQTLVDAAGGGGVAVLADCYPHPRLVRTGADRSESSAVSEIILPSQAGAGQSTGAVVVLSRQARPRHAGRHGVKGTGERVWSKTAAGGLDAVGSAFSGTLLRMLQTSQTTLAELVDKLPDAVWAQSETKQVTFVLDGLGDDARRMYITEE